MRVAATEATGSVSAVAKARTGVRLEVAALTRHADDRSAARAGASIGDAQPQRRALDGKTPVYELVHSLDVDDRRVVDGCVKDGSQQSRHACEPR